MKRIYVQNGIVFFYGNPAGYLGDGKAVIDCMFQKEELVSFVKERFLVEPVFREGVYDRLSEGGGVKETAEVSIGEGRRLRIYQLGQDSPIMMRFISLAERKKRGYDRPRREEYVRVYEGEIENYSLEEVWKNTDGEYRKGFRDMHCPFRMWSSLRMGKSAAFSMSSHPGMRKSDFNKEEHYAKGKNCPEPGRNHRTARAIRSREQRKHPAPV
jgi:hypothetical protein